jgi:hypothetical protein
VNPPENLVSTNRVETKWRFTKKSRIRVEGFVSFWIIGTGLPGTPSRIFDRRRILEKEVEARLRGNVLSARKMPQDLCFVRSRVYH